MEREQIEGAALGGAPRWTFRAPLILAAIVICGINGLNLARLVPTHAPCSPWEAIQVVESWRSLHGLPVYELAADGHATHFYGALAPWFQGEVFRWFGPSNIAGRILTLLSALALVTLIALCMRTKGSAWTTMIVWAALLGCNHRSFQYYRENRPDMTALFLGSVALVILYRGMERRGTWWVLLGTAWLIVSFFFKQTTLVFATVPAIVLALRGRWPSRKEILLALVPLAAAAGTVFWLKAFCPAIYHYMIEVPASFRISWTRAAALTRVFLLESPLFLILLGEWLVAEGGSIRKDARMAWVLAVLIVALPSGAMAQAKFGGTPNSMLPPMLAMMAFCGLRLPNALAWLERSMQSPRGRVTMGSFAAAILLLTIFPRSYLFVARPSWALSYDKVIAATASLPGKVICPEDPTIPLFARSYAGLALFGEMDAHAENGFWPKEMPRRVVDEMRSADYVIEVKDYWNGHLDLKALERLGFKPDDQMFPDAINYRFWRRTTAPGLTGSRTAWNDGVNGKPASATE